MKKGAILGIVQHREMKIWKNFDNGYVKESFLIEFIEEIGFQFVEKLYQCKFKKTQKIIKGA